jgi:uncharacterized protein YkwD
VLHVVRRLSLLLLIVFGGLSAYAFSETSLQPAQATSTSEFCTESVDSQLLSLINNYRQSKGIAPLAASQALGAAAEHHAWDMELTGTYSHTMSDGTTWSQNISNHGYTYTGRGENIAWGYTSAQATFDAWKSSSGHNAAMLNSGYRAIGLGTVINTAGGHTGYNWVNTFGSTVDGAARACSGTAVPTPTSPLATATKAPATATPTTAASTSTAVAPTATNAPATATPVPPTATTAPLTATAVPPTATSPALVPVPAAPTGLKNAKSNAKWAVLAWNDNASNETGYRVYRSSDGGATWMLTGDQLSANETRFQERDGGLVKGRTYKFFVVAYNASGESGRSNIISIVAK